MLKDASKDVFDALGRALERVRPAISATEVGVVAAVSQGTARISGLTRVRSDELMDLGGGKFGVASSIKPDSLGVILLCDSDEMLIGQEVARTGRVVDVPVGEALLGRVLDPLGMPLDDRAPPDSVSRRAVEQPAPAIIHRAPVATPLQTGITAVDAAIPIGRGQRELILGDRQTGKTAVAVDTIINQRETDVVCIYCSIGQRASAVAKVINDIRKHGNFDNTIVMVAGGNDPPGLQFIAPYAATSVAESFMEEGRDVLIVYDDLTRHARAYRELSLLLRRPPGREAYPGDIFYAHSRMLERATHLREDLGGGSMTALPIIETHAQNISAYIPTNLISITDGQIYLSPTLYRRGHLPAVDIGQSVSRVGGKAQRPAYRAVAGNLRLSYSQFEELEMYASFGTRLDEDTRRTLERGRRVRQVLKQPEHAPLTVSEQIIVLLAATHGLFDELPVGRVERAVGRLREAESDELSAVKEAVENETELSDDQLGELTERMRAILEEWQAETEAAKESGGGDGDT